MPREVSGYDQLQAEDIAAQMGRVAAQVTTNLEILKLHQDTDFDAPDFYDAVAQETAALCDRWLRLLAARDKLIGEESVAF